MKQNGKSLFGRLVLLREGRRKRDFFFHKNIHTYTNAHTHTDTYTKRQFLALYSPVCDTRTNVCLTMNARLCAIRVSIKRIQQQRDRLAIWLCFCDYKRWIRPRDTRSMCYTITSNVKREQKRDEKRIERRV